MTGNTDINSLLSDLGPGLWKSINPGYFSASDKLLVCSSHATHTFEKDGEWNAPVRRTKVQSDAQLHVWSQALGIEGGHCAAG